VEQPAAQAKPPRIQAAASCRANRRMGR
jgi:hypothetical protein